MGALCITRREGERVRIRLGDINIWLRVIETGGQTKLCFWAPAEVQILREELLPDKERFLSLLAETLE